MNAVAAHGLSKRQSSSVVESVFDIIFRCFEKGEDVKIVGFGHFRIRPPVKPITRMPACLAPAMPWTESSMTKLLAGSAPSVSAACRKTSGAGFGLPEDEAVLLARYEVARWAAYPVVWILAGDGLKPRLHPRLFYFIRVLFYP